jgi:hypothetical protein
MTEHGVGMVYVDQGYKFVKPGIIFRWCKQIHLYIQNVYTLYNEVYLLKPVV